MTIYSAKEAKRPSHSHRHRPRHRPRRHLPYHTPRRTRSAQDTVSSRAARENQLGRRTARHAITRETQTGDKVGKTKCTQTIRATRWHCWLLHSTTLAQDQSPLPKSLHGSNIPRGRAGTNKSALANPDKKSPRSPERVAPQKSTYHHKHSTRAKTGLE